MRVVLSDGAPLTIKRCELCSAPIIWALDERGVRLGVDAAPALPYTGDLIVYFETLVQFGREVETGPYRVKRATPDDEKALRGWLWLAHASTCVGLKFRQGRTGRRV